MTDAYIGLGANLGDRAAHLAEALRLLGQTPGLTVTRTSLVYETEPVGGVPQDDYLNQVVALTTTLPPLALLNRLHAIEAALHRQRIVRWGPRTVDLDLLLYGDTHLETPTLTVPHPELANRRFVLVPLLEVASPALAPQVQQWLATTPDTHWLRPYTPAKDETHG
ncbi:2-amino-4-hydroxy-6-hydroxymethyldihydropteridine diphosphokinase [Lacticaseibacillus daqingensis]|uniref:2-amino-4-hydroxy-6- hydroxymethyldihydropteridine diphosphokinase n=1 Tax=Lacticaseibacillus daqingensis TaxID=2486014 RepID=UPI000F76D082|nr:2-amino-4-hydroxy-6-hydroxymethyldihydropteridine diphosphokinase [Lacticaseibacillus daqingensis]